MKAIDYKERCAELLDRFDKSIEDCIQMSQKDSGTNVNDLADPFENPQREDLNFMFQPYPKMDEILREFLHLVYSFDPNIPLYKEICEPDSLKIGSPYLDPKRSEADRERVRGFMKFFIQYINEYCDEDE